MTTKLEVFNHALRLIGELPLTDLNQNVPNRHLLDNAWATTIPDCFTQAPWNFAIKKSSLQNITQQIIPQTSTGPGNPVTRASNEYEKPDDWLSTAYMYADKTKIYASTNNEDVTDADYYKTARVAPIIAEARKKDITIRDIGGNIITTNNVADIGAAIGRDRGTGEIITITPGYGSAVFPIFMEYISSDFATDDANVAKWTPQFAQFVAYALAVDINSTSTQNVDLQEMLKKELVERQQLAIARNQKDDPQKRNPTDPDAASRLSIYTIKYCDDLVLEQLLTTE